MSFTRFFDCLGTKSLWEVLLCIQEKFGVLAPWPFSVGLPVKYDLATLAAEHHIEALLEVFCIVPVGDDRAEVEF